MAVYRRGSVVLCPLAQRLKGTTMPTRVSLRLFFILVFCFASAASLVVPQDRAGDHFNRGVALYDKGDLDAAIAEYREALHLKPDYADAHLNLGIALKAKGGLDGAIAAYRQALDLQPNEPKAHYNLGIALAARGNKDEAAREFEIGRAHV